MNPELVLVISDMFVPQRAPDIAEQFKTILIPNKIQHVLSLGNIGSRESYDWLKSLSNDFHTVKGDFDDGDMPDRKVVQIGNFKLGLIHGHQVVPWGNYEALSLVQRELDCDILLTGFTHKIGVKVLENKLYLNPGSISGAFSSTVADPSPSFALIVLQGYEAVIYFYVLNDRTQKFDVHKVEYTKGAENYRSEIDFENEDDGQNQEQEVQEPPAQEGEEPQNKEEKEEQEPQHKEEEQQQEAQEPPAQEKEE